jgi:hypothetical protein
MSSDSWISPFDELGDFSFASDGDKVRVQYLGRRSSRPAVCGQVAVDANGDAFHVVALAPLRP